jgi:hypothetical protein
VRRESVGQRTVRLAAEADEAVQLEVWRLLARLHHDPRNVTTVVILQAGVLVVDTGAPVWHRFTPRRPADSDDAPPPPSSADPTPPPATDDPMAEFL